MFTIKNRNKLALLSLLLCGVTLPVMTMADDATDRKIVASKAYVDTKQNRIAATSDGTDSSPNYVYDSSTNPTAAGAVVTTTTTAGTTGQRGIATAPTYDNNDTLSNGDWLPTMGAVMTAINSHVPTGTANTIANYDSTGALGAGIATYDGSGTYNSSTDSGKIATAAAVETKQDIIPTDNVVFIESDGEKIPEDITVPALVITNFAGTALNGDKIGLLNYTIASGLGGDPTLQYLSDATYDNFVPTVRTVSHALLNIYNTALIRFPWNQEQEQATNAYSTTFNNGTNNWPSANANQLANGTALANGLALKQNKIPAGTSGNVVTYTGTAGSVGSVAVASAPSYTGNTLNNGGSLANITAVETKQNKISATSDGTDSSPNYVYDSSTNPTAAGAVVTTTTTAGTTGQRGIATAPTYDNNDTLSNGDWLPTMGAVMTAINSHVPTGTANTIANYDSTGALGTGIATYNGSGTYDSTNDAGKIATAAAVETKQNQIAATSDGTNNTPNYVYDATTNQYAAGSVVTTTTTPGTVGERGIATAPTYDSGNNLSNGSWLPTMGAVMTAISSAVPSGTANNVAMYDSNGDLGDGQPTANAATYNNDTLTNGNSIATIAAVETKVSKTQSTGYQILTTGTTGTVTAEYLAVPVTTSGTGRPAANNAPTGTAAIWIE